MQPESQWEMRPAVNFNSSQSHVSVLPSKRTGDWTERAKHMRTSPALFMCLLAYHQVTTHTRAVIQVTFTVIIICVNYLVCAPCRCSRTRGRSPGRAAAGLAPCVASYPCPGSGTTPGHWGSSEHTWSPPGDVHILCCWWRKSGDHTQQEPMIKNGEL